MAESLVGVFGNPGYSTKRVKRVRKRNPNSSNRQFRRIATDTKLPVPLTDAAALRVDTPWEIGACREAFLLWLAEDAEDWLQRLGHLDRAWLGARCAVADRLRQSPRRGPDRLGELDRIGVARGSAERFRAARRVRARQVVFHLGGSRAS